jgi:hypothetical protein
MSMLMNLLSGAGAAMDVPGATVRNTLAGRNPFQPLANPFEWEGRVAGRDLLAQYGLASREPTGRNMAGGYLAEVVLDPLAWGGVGALSRALGMGARGARAVGTASRAGQAAGSAAPVARAAGPATGRTAGAMAMSVGPPAVGAYMIGENMNDPQEQQAWKNWAGAGLMATPLVLGMARGVGMPIEKLVQIPLDQLTKPNRKRLNDLARRRDASPEVMKRAEEMWRRDIRTKPPELLTEAEKSAAQAAFREAGATGGKPAGPRLGDQVYRERLPKLEAELTELKKVKPKTLGGAERTARDRRMHQLRAEISQAKKRIAETSATTPEGPSARPATKPTLAERLAEPQQQRSPTEGPVAPRPADTPAAKPAPATPPPGKVTLDDAFTEHYSHMRNFFNKQFRDKGFKGDTREELIADAMARVWGSVQKRPDMGFVPPGEEGWKRIYPFLEPRGIDAMRVHLNPGRGTVGTAGSKSDAYRLGRKELAEGVPDQRYEAEVGRMGTVADQRTGAMQAELEGRSQVSDIIESVGKDDPKMKGFLEAYAEFTGNDVKPTQEQLAQRMSEMGFKGTKGAETVDLRTIRNLKTKLRGELEAAGYDPEWLKTAFPLLAALLGLGGATGGALARRVASIPEMPEQPAEPLPAAGPFSFASVDGAPISPRWA